MSIRTIDKQIQGTEGIKKKINKGAEKMVFDILQSTQYSMPFSSTVRELVTNACDSQREKEIAIEILTGKKKEEDYYIARDGEQYSDSNFKRDYYNIQHLNQEINDVEIVYEKHKGVGFCDRFRIIDHGVGIGDRRMEGVLELGYSTKRNTSENFGAFGLGAKAALSTGVDFYTIETIHNGKRFKCNCYNYKTDFIIPKFNVKTGKENPFVTFSDGTKVYYEETNALNMTEISFGVKKHNRNKVEDSIEEQLLYLPQVKFYTDDHEDGGEPYRHENKFHPEVTYNSKNLIISDTYVFSRPHIVVVRDHTATAGINYGFVDFRELEMESLWGPIAFKCPMKQTMLDPDTGEEIILQDGVDVTPSREKVIWNDATKAYVQKLIKAASAEASELVEKELEETDFIKWLEACDTILSKGSDNSAISRIANIIDKEDLKPKYSVDKSIAFSGPKSLFKDLDVKVIYIKRDYNKGNDVIEREPIDKWSYFKADRIYLKDKNTDFSKYKDLHIANNEVGSVGTFIVISAKNDLTIPDKIQLMQEGQEKVQAMKLWNKQVKKRDRVWELLMESECIKSYDDVEIDEEWLADYKEEMKSAEEVAKFESITPEERREIEKRQVAYTLRLDDKKDSGFTWDKIEPKTKDLMRTQRVTYYGSTKDEHKFHVAGIILKKQAQTYNETYPNCSTNYGEGGGSEPMYFIDTIPVRYISRWGTHANKFPKDMIDNVKKDVNDCPQLIRVNEKVAKHLGNNSNCKHIDEFYLQLGPNNEYTMDKHLTKWYTASRLENINDLEWMSLLKGLHPTLFNTFKDLYNLREDTYDRWASDKVVKKSDLYKDIEKIVTFQRYCLEVEDEDDKESLIAAKSRELFVVDVEECAGLDMKVENDYKDLLEFADDMGNLLSKIENCCPDPNDDDPIDTELEKELKVYLKAKNRLEWE